MTGSFGLDFLYLQAINNILKESVESLETFLRCSQTRNTTVLRAAGSFANLSHLQMGNAILKVYKYERRNAL